MWLLIYKELLVLWYLHFLLPLQAEKFILLHYYLVWVLHNLFISKVIYYRAVFCAGTCYRHSWVTTFCHRPTTQWTHHEISKEVHPQLLTWYSPLLWPAWHAEPRQWWLAFDTDNHWCFWNCFMVQCYSDSDPCQFCPPRWTQWGFLELWNVCHSEI